MTNYARPVHRLLACALAVACASEPSPPPAVATAPAPPIAPPAAETAPEPVPEPEPDAAAPLPPLPVGPASLGVHLPRGGRQPVTLVGRVLDILPPKGDHGLDAWTEVQLAGAGSGPQRFYLLATPEQLALPLAVGQRIVAEIDCRKGGWHRVCDAVVMDSMRRTLLIVSGSGDDTLAEGWSIERGPVATSEIRAGAERSVEHTHALIVTRSDRSLTVSPHAWQRFQLRGESWLVTGYAVVWEGRRPPDARDHRVFAFVRER